MAFPGAEAAGSGPSFVFARRIRNGAFRGSPASGVPFAASSSHPALTALQPPATLVLPSGSKSRRHCFVEPRRFPRLFVLEIPRGTASAPYLVSGLCFQLSRVALIAVGSLGLSFPMSEDLSILPRARVCLAKLCLVLVPYFSAFFFLSPQEVCVCGLTPTVGCI